MSEVRVTTIELDELIRLRRRLVLERRDREQAEVQRREERNEQGARVVRVTATDKTQTKDGAG